MFCFWKNIWLKKKLKQLFRTLKSKFTSGITWRQKVEKVKDYKVTDIPIRMQKRFGKGTILIPRPSDLEALIRKIKKGKLVTKSELRRKLAKDFNADITCPITSGIFLRIISEASEEDFEKGKKRITPYWRVVTDEGSLNEKFPGGITRQSENLKRERHEIEKSKNGKLYVVKNFENKLTPLV